MYYNGLSEQSLHSPRFAQQLQRLYDKYDLLCDAFHNIQRAAEALEQCRDIDQTENLSVLEQISSDLIRDRDITHAKLEQMEALERNALTREAVD